MYFKVKESTAYFILFDDLTLFDRQVMLYIPYCVCFVGQIVRGINILH